MGSGSGLSTASRARAGRTSKNSCRPKPERFPRYSTRGLMATKSKQKAVVRSGKGKAGRRPVVKVKRGSDIPILPVAVGGILLALAIAAIAYIVISNRPTPGPQVAGGVPCDSLEHTQVHYHAALQIIYKGSLVFVPDNTGINLDSTGTVTCYYWLHVHPANKNVIHIESPATQTFTVGQFMAVWKTWAQQNDQAIPKLDSTHVGTFTLTPDEKVVIYVDDGKGPQVFTGDPNTIVLHSHEVITLEISPPTVAPPPSFNWTSTANQGL